MNITYIIIIVTALASVTAFQSSELMDRWIMRPYDVKYRNQWYRFITSGFIHANWSHLIINMLVFYSFAIVVTQYYDAYFGARAVYYFIMLYLGGMIIADVPTYFKHREQSWYASLGASGAVSAVTFASVLIEPRSMIYLMGFVPLPAIIWAVGYLVYSQYMGRRGGDNINHSAHFYGAVFGLIYTLALRPAFAIDFVHKLISQY
ncbi:MAG: rhomboid family intramembrane serine protease [Chitinophagales bacterium]